MDLRLLFRPIFLHITHYYKKNVKHIMFEYLVMDSKLSSLNISLKSVYSDFKNKKHSIDIIDVCQIILHIELFQKKRI